MGPTIQKSDTVYLIGTRGEGEYKIGVTYSPETRLKQLQLQTKTPGLKLLHRIPVASTLLIDGEWVEKYIQYAFGDYRLKSKSEWFCLPPACVELVRSIGPIENHDHLPAFLVERFQSECEYSGNHRYHMEVARLRRIMSSHNYDERRKAVRQSSLTSLWQRRALMEEINRVEEYTKKRREEFRARFEAVNSAS